jgi:hypothetical protein
MLSGSSASPTATMSSSASSIAIAVCVDSSSPTVPRHVAQLVDIDRGGLVSRSIRDWSCVAISPENVALSAGNSTTSQSTGPNTSVVSVIW